MKTLGKPRSFVSLMLVAIGVVYGDIGTSPLYTLRECFAARYGFSVEQSTVYGFLSLIFWMQIFIVSLKYIAFVLRADNAGEGGILTLMSLARRFTKPTTTAFLIALGLIGGSFFYGEVVITPAISVLSAIEGLEIIAPQLDRFVVPIALIVLTLLFVIQKKGSGSIGNLFGPIMVLWFIVLAILGLKSIIITPQVLHALNPVWAIEFFLQYKSSAFLALGAAVLSITGVEALYADIGHFGKFPIRFAWFTLILPALILNYFGQGALLLRSPEAIQNPFFLLAPHWALIPLLILATLATIIASQAVVSGVFTLTHQAVRQGFMPPMQIIYTSEQEAGQIYIPNVNWILYAAVVFVILLFEHSGNLASAYGIAVTGTMILTSILVCIVAYNNWNWSLTPVLVLLTCLLCIDIPLFTANALKFFSGGWLPILLGFLVLIIMVTWKTERSNLFRKLHERSNTLEALIIALEKTPPARVQGTAVYMTRTTKSIPSALTHNLKHNKVLHNRVIFLTLKTVNVPRVHQIRRVEVEQLSPTFWRVVASYGFKETPNLEDVFLRCAQQGLTCRMMEISFFLSHESLLLGPRPWFQRIKGKLFIALSRNSLRAADQFAIPANRVIELGIQVEI